MTRYISLYKIIGSEIISICSESYNSTTKTWYLFMDCDTIHLTHIKKILNSQPRSRPTRQRSAAHQWAAAHRLRTAALTFTDRRERHKESQGQEDRQPETKRQTCRQIERERQRDKYIGYTDRHRETEKQINIQTKREGVTNRDRETPNGHAYRNSFSSVFVDSQCHIT